MARLEAVLFQRVLLILFFSLSLSASEIKVAVAANVSFAINELISAFNQKYPDVKVEVILGSSGKLNAQIKRGAPFDIFMSANRAYPQDIFDKNLAIAPAKIYAQGLLAMFSEKPRDFSKGIYTLKNRDISKIAIANPTTAPYGKATLEALKNAKLYNTIKDKLVYAQSISQTVQYALTAVDVAFIAKSSLFSSKMRRFKEGKNWTELDTELYRPIKQGVVIIKSTKNLKASREFYDFLFNKEAKKVFKKYGYL
jgi:molybdate transport system substrate-binding protein